MPRDLNTLYTRDRCAYYSQVVLSVLAGSRLLLRAKRHRPGSATKPLCL
jgi:hypothetical protein